MAYYIGALLVETGDYQAHEYMLFETKENPNDYLDTLASAWYGSDPKVKEEGRYLFDGGQVAISVYKSKKISKKTYDELFDII